MQKTLIVGLLLIGIIVAGVALQMLAQLRAQPGPAPEGVLCAMDTQLCPDGSYVGRIPPQCDFAACPTGAPSGNPYASTSTKTYMSATSTASFTYPIRLLTSYIGTVDWPPTPQVFAGPYSCSTAGSVTSTAGRTEMHTVNGHTYCVTAESEGAAGSIYSMYAYAMPKDGKVVILTFSLRYPQCGNYPDPQKTACEKERSAFSVDELMDPIMQSITLR